MTEGRRFTFVFDNPSREASEQPPVSSCRVTLLASLGKYIFDVRLDEEGFTKFEKERHTSSEQRLTAHFRSLSSACEE
jgi:hypothetical protein